MFNIMKERSKLPKVSIGFLQQCLLFTVVLIASNIFETKQIAVGPINITGGMLTFPICYIIVKIVCEVWGYRRTIILVWMGFLLNFLFIVAAAIVDWLPGAEYWTNDEGFHAIFGLSASSQEWKCSAKPSSSSSLRPPTKSFSSR